MAARLAVTVVALSIAVAVFAAPASAATAPTAYMNHTVGGAAGWFFNDTTNSSATNYTAWPATQSFYLGDYLIFNTNTNLTVVQSSNATTYGLCSADEDDGNETSVYADDGNLGFGVPATLAVPLTVEGPNYYFSNAGDDRVQCLQGMRFQISVGHGLGLPPELSQPPPPPFMPPPSSWASSGGGASNSGALGRSWVGSTGLVWSMVFGVGVGFLLA